MKTPCTAAPLFFLGCLILFLRGPQTASADDAPEISIQPQSLALIASEDAQFSVTASGTEPLAYQWRFNRANVDGANSAAYDINYVQTEQIGDYEVVVSNAAGVVTSSVATLTVDYPRVLTDQPEAWVSIAEGGVGGTVHFSVAPLPHPPVAYQWRFNGSNIAGKTSSNLVVRIESVANGGEYSVWVTTSAGGTVGPATKFEVLTVKAAREQWRTNAVPTANFSIVAKTLTDEHGNLYVAANYSPAGIQSAKIVKLANAGHSLWTLDFSGDVYDMALDSEGNIYTVGSTVVGAGPYYQAYLTAKYNAAGSNLWSAIYTLFGGGRAQGVAVDGAGNVYVTGVIAGTNTTFPADCATVKYDRDGNQVWARRFDSGGHDYGYGIALDTETNLVVVGESGGVGSPWGSLALKYDMNGNQLWRNPDSFGEGRKVLFGTNDNPFVANARGGVAQLNKSNGLVIGYSAMSGASPELLVFSTDGRGRMFAVGRSGGTDHNFVVHSIQHDGTGEWNDSFPGYAYAGAVDQRGNVYVVGRQPGFGSQCRIVKWNREGWRAWVIEPAEQSTGLGVSADKDFNVSVVGGGTVINYEQNHRLHTLGFQRNGSFRLALTGEPRVPVWLKVSTNLLDWLDLSELQFSVATADFTDADASTLPFRFYRTEGVMP